MPRERAIDLNDRYAMEESDPGHVRQVCYITLNPPISTAADSLKRGNYQSISCPPFGWVVLHFIHRNCALSPLFPLSTLSIVLLWHCGSRYQFELPTLEPVPKDASDVTTRGSTRARHLPALRWSKSSTGPARLFDEDPNWVLMETMDEAFKALPGMMIEHNDGAPHWLLLLEALAHLIVTGYRFLVGVLVEIYNPFQGCPGWLALTGTESKLPLCPA